MTNPPDASRTARKPIDIALIAIVRHAAEGPEVLLTKRPERVHLGGYWELPGGKVEPGTDGTPEESPQAAACREAREELGVTLSQDDLEACGCTTHAYPDRAIRFHLFIHRTDGEHSAILGRITAPTAWVPIEQLDCWHLPPANAAINRLLA